MVGVIELCGSGRYDDGELFYRSLDRPYKSSSLILVLILKWSFCVTAFIQSDTILEVLHFDEGRLLQVRT